MTYPQFRRPIQIFGGFAHHEIRDALVPLIRIRDGGDGKDLPHPRVCDEDFCAVQAPPFLFPDSPGPVSRLIVSRPGFGEPESAQDRSAGQKG